MQISVKFLPLYGVIAFLCTFAYAAYHGRLYGRTRDTLMLAHHKSGVLASALTLGLTVVLIEMMLYELKPARSWIFPYHLPTALGMTGVFILMASYATGLRFATLHRRLARVFVVLLVLAASTGAVMTVQM